MIFKNKIQYIEITTYCVLISSGSPLCTHNIFTNLTTMGLRHSLHVDTLEIL